MKGENNKENGHPYNLRFLQRQDRSQTKKSGDSFGGVHDNKQGTFKAKYARPRECSAACSSHNEQIFLKHKRNVKTILSNICAMENNPNWESHKTITQSTDLVQLPSRKNLNSATMGDSFDMALLKATVDSIPDTVVKTRNLRPRKSFKISSAYNLRARDKNIVNHSCSGNIKGFKITKSMKRKLKDANKKMSSTLGSKTRTAGNNKSPKRSHKSSMFSQGAFRSCHLPLTSSRFNLHACKCSIDDNLRSVSSLSFIKDTQKNYVQFNNTYSLRARNKINYEDDSSDFEDDLYSVSSSSVTKSCLSSYSLQSNSKYSVHPRYDTRSLSSMSDTGFSINSLQSDRYSLRPRNRLSCDTTSLSDTGVSAGNYSLQSNRRYSLRPRSRISDDARSLSSVSDVRVSVRNDSFQSNSRYGLRPRSRISDDARSLSSVSDVRVSVRNDSFQSNSRYSLRPRSRISDDARSLSSVSDVGVSVRNDSFRSNNRYSLRPRSRISDDACSLSSVSVRNCSKYSPRYSDMYSSCESLETMSDQLPFSSLAVKEKPLRKHNLRKRGKIALSTLSDTEVSVRKYNFRKRENFLSTINEESDSSNITENSRCQVLRKMPTANVQSKVNKCDLSEGSSGRYSFRSRVRDSVIKEDNITEEWKSNKPHFRKNKSCSTVPVTEASFGECSLRSKTRTHSVGLESKTKEVLAVSQSTCAPSGGRTCEIRPRSTKETKDLDRHTTRSRKEQKITEQNSFRVRSQNIVKELLKRNVSFGLKASEFNTEQVINLNIKSHDVLDEGKRSDIHYEENSRQMTLQNCFATDRSVAEGKVLQDKLNTSNNNTLTRNENELPGAKDVQTLSEAVYTQENHSDDYSTHAVGLVNQHSKSKADEGIQDCILDICELMLDLSLTPEENSSQRSSLFFKNETPNSTVTSLQKRIRTNIRSVMDKNLAANQNILHSSSGNEISGENSTNSTKNQSLPVRDLHDLVSEDCSGNGTSSTDDKAVYKSYNDSMETTDSLLEQNILVTENSIIPGAEHTHNKFPVSIVNCEGTDVNTSSKKVYDKSKDIKDAIMETDAVENNNSGDLVSKDHLKNQVNEVACSAELFLYKVDCEIDNDNASDTGSLYSINDASDLSADLENSVMNLQLNNSQETGGDEIVAECNNSNKNENNCLSLYCINDASDLSADIENSVMNPQLNNSQETGGDKIVAECNNSNKSENNCLVLSNTAADGRFEYSPRDISSSIKEPTSLIESREAGPTEASVAGFDDLTLADFDDAGPNTMEDAAPVVPLFDSVSISLSNTNGSAGSEADGDQSKQTPYQGFILTAKTLTGHLVEIKIDQDRPKSFKNEKAMHQWDQAVFRNALKLKDQIETGKYIPDDIKKELDRKVQLKEEEKSILKRDKIMERKKSKLRWLKLESRLVELDALVKSRLSLQKAEPEKCMAHLDEIASLNIDPLMLKKHPQVVETVKKLRRYIGNTTEWNLDDDAKTRFTNQASQIREKADHIYNKFKTLFTVPEGRTFWQVFADHVTLFKQQTSHLSQDKLYSLTVDPVSKRSTESGSSDEEAAEKRQTQEQTPRQDSEGEEENRAPGLKKLPNRDDARKR